jgi:hypothetical protein
MTMSVSLTTPVTGAAVTGFTAPTYTVAVDTPPNTWSKQWAVTAIGGTQTGADTSSAASRPWTITAYRPSSIKTLNAIDTTGVLRVVGFNTYGVLTRKGMTPLAGQASRTAQMRSEFSIPAGADTADVPNIKAAVSSHIGVLNQQSAGLADTLATAVL